MNLGEYQEKLKNGGSNAPDFDTVLEGDHASLAELMLHRVKLGSDQPVIRAEDRYWRYSERKGIWEHVTDNELRRCVMNMRGSVRWESADGQMKLIRITSSLTKSVMDLAEILADAEGFFDTAVQGLAFSDGFAVVTKSGVRLRPHSADNRARFAYDFDFVEPEDAECSAWIRFLESLFEHDQDKLNRLDFLQQFIGGALTGQSTQHARALMLLGDGANGKSVFCDALAELFPSGSVVQVPPHAMSDSFHVVHLAGATLNLVTDIPTRELRDAGTFKQVTSGDPVQARFLRKDFFSFRPHAAHVFSANELPHLYDHSPGFFRRWVMLRFSETFNDQNPNKRDKHELLDELYGELPHIMAWALRGAVELMRRGCYLMPPSHQEEIDGWRVNVDQVVTFIQERVRDHKGDYGMGSTDTGVLYRAYRAWAEENGHGILSHRKFTQRATAYGLRSKRASGRVWACTVQGRMSPNLNDIGGEDD